MAKKFVDIDTSKAIASLKALTIEIGLHNKAIGASIKQLDLFAPAVQKAKDQMYVMRDMAKSVAGHLQTLADKTDAVNTKMGGLNTRLGTLNKHVSASRTSIKGLSTEADKLALTFGGLNNATAQFQSALQRDSMALFQNTRDLREFDREVRRITQGMRLKNLTVAQQIQLMNADAGATQRATKNAFELYFSLRNIVRIGANIIFFGAVYKGIEYLRNATKEAQQWHKAISEIRTISDRAAMSTEAWMTQLTTLSNSSGLSALDAMEGAYQALSNQVTNATNTISFLSQEQTLAITAVSNLKHAVDATSSIIQAYGVNSASAANINAVLFRGVELGRFRLQDVAETIGRVAILSSQLGVSFEEQTAAMSLITKQGVNASEAMTYLRNVEFALIKPTDEMKNKLREWGFTSGETAVKALGLVEVLRRIAEEADKGGNQASEFVELMGRLRSVIGLTALTQKNYAKEVEAYAVSAEKYLTAYIERLGSFDTRANAQLQRFHNTWMAVGLSILKVLVETTETSGGAGVMLVRYAGYVEKLTVAFLAYKTAAGASNLVASTVAAVARINENALWAETRAAWAVTAARATATLGVAALIYQYYRITTAARDYRWELIALAEEEKANADRKSGVNTLQIQQTIDRDLNAQLKAYKERLKASRELNRALQIETDKAAESFKEAWEEAARTMKATVEAPLKELHEQLTAERTEIERIRKDIEHRRVKTAKDAAAANIRDEIQDVTDNDELTAVEKVQRLNEIRVRLFKEAGDAIANDDSETSDILLANAKELGRTQQQLLKEKLREEKRTNRELETEEKRAERAQDARNARQMQFFFGGKKNPLNMVRRMTGLSWDEAANGAKYVQQPEFEPTDAQKAMLERAQKRFPVDKDSADRNFKRGLLELQAADYLTTIENLRELIETLKTASDMYLQYGNAGLAAAYKQKQAQAERELKKLAPEESTEVKTALLLEKIKHRTNEEARIAQEREDEFGKRQLALAKEREAALLTRTVQFDRFKAALHEVDSFTPDDIRKMDKEKASKAVTKYMVNLTKAQEFARVIGVTPEQYKIIFESAEAQKTQIMKLAATYRTQTALEEDTKRINALEEQEKNAVEARRQWYNAKSVKPNEIAVETLGPLVTIGDILKDAETKQRTVGATQPRSEVTQEALKDKYQIRLPFSNFDVATPEQLKFPVELEKQIKKTAELDRAILKAASWSDRQRAYKAFREELVKTREEYEKFMKLFPTGYAPNSSGLVVSAKDLQDYADKLDIAINRLKVFEEEVNTMTENLPSYPGAPGDRGATGPAGPSGGMFRVPDDVIPRHISYKPPRRDAGPTEYRQLPDVQEYNQRTDRLKVLRAARERYLAAYKAYMDAGVNATVQQIYELKASGQGLEAEIYTTAGAQAILDRRKQRAANFDRIYGTRAEQLAKKIATQNAKDVLPEELTAKQAVERQQAEDAATTRRAIEQGLGVRPITKSEQLRQSRKAEVAKQIAAAKERLKTNWKNNVPREIEERPQMVVGKSSPLERKPSGKVNFAPGADATKVYKKEWESFQAQGGGATGRLNHARQRYQEAQRLYYQAIETGTPEEIFRLKDEMIRAGQDLELEIANGDSSMRSEFNRMAGVPEIDRSYKPTMVERRRKGLDAYGQPMAPRVKKPDAEPATLPKIAGFPGGQEQVEPWWQPNDAQEQLKPRVPPLDIDYKPPAALPEAKPETYSTPQKKELQEPWWTSDLTGDSVYGIKMPVLTIKKQIVGLIDTFKTLGTMPDLTTELRRHSSEQQPSVTDDRYLPRMGSEAWILDRKIEMLRFARNNGLPEIDPNVEYTNELDARARYQHKEDRIQLTSRIRPTSGVHEYMHMLDAKGGYTEDDKIRSLVMNNQDRIIQAATIYAKTNDYGATKTEALRDNPREMLALLSEGVLPGLEDLRQQLFGLIRDKSIEKLDEQIQKATNELGNALQSFNQKFQEIQKPQGFALGGTISADNIPAFLARGETVLTAAQSRYFAPFIRSTTNQQTQTNQTSLNFGDINVSVPAGTHQDQAGKVIAEIQRRVRLGQLQL